MTAKLALYLFDGCPWCERVRAAIDDLQLNIEERDTRAVPEHDRELRTATGNGTVPVLRIDTTDRTQWLSESADIVRYLYAEHGAGRQPTFLASTLPQRTGIIGAAVLLCGSFLASPAWQSWLIAAAAGVWLLGNRAPLLRRLF